MILRTLLFTVLALGGWTAFVVTGTIEGWWRQPLAPFGDTKAFQMAAVAEIDTKHKGNVAYVVISKGSVATHFASIGKPVDGDSRFQVASMSKWITAWGVMTLVEAGKLRALAVSSKKRLDIMPDVPTFAEVGLKELEIASWTMVVSPAKTPMPIVERLHVAVKDAAKLPATLEVMRRTGFAPVDSPSIDEMRTFMKAEIQRWGDVVRNAGIAGAE